MRWHTANNGAGRYPWFVTRGDGSHAEYAETGPDFAPTRIRRFATRETAQKLADKLNKAHYDSPEMKSARVHLEAAIRMLTRATNDAQPNDARLRIITALHDAYQELTD